MNDFELSLRHTNGCQTQVLDLPGMTRNSQQKDSLAVAVQRDREVTAEETKYIEKALQMR